MSRPGDQAQAIATPDTVYFTTDERIAFIAELIANRIAEDEANGLTLLDKIKAEYHEAD